MKFLLIPIFAILNRWRGSDWPVPQGAFLAKILTGFLLGFIVNSFEFNLYLAAIAPLMFLLYWIGEMPGWGVWIGSIVDDKSRNLNSSLNHRVGLDTKIIHYIANFFFKEKKNFLRYSYFALFVRGLIWWIPSFVAILILKNMELFRLSFALIGISALFPVSFGLTRFLPDYSYRWKVGEVIYGAFQGLIFTLLLF